MCLHGRLGCCWRLAFLPNDALFAHCRRTIFWGGFFGVSVIYLDVPALSRVGLEQKAISVCGYLGNGYSRYRYSNDFSLGSGSDGVLR